MASWFGRQRKPSDATGPFARYAWHFHGRASLLFGIWAGIAIHSEYILLKILDGTPTDLAWMVTIGTAGLLTGILSGPLMQGRPKRPFFLIFGAGGRIGLIIMAFADTPMFLPKIGNQLSKS